MDGGTEQLGGFFDRSPQSADRQVREPLRMELFQREAMGKHVNHLGNPNTGAFNGEFAACAVRTGFKVGRVHRYMHSSKKTTKSQFCLRARSPGGIKELEEIYFG